jgi:DNA repair protein RecO (recombination protein O)
MKRGPYKSEAIVLFTMDYGESDVILTLYTPEYGKIKGIAKGARRSRRRFVGALEPPSHISMNFFCSGKSDLVRVDDAKLLDGFDSLKADIETVTYGSYFLELVNEMTGEGQGGHEIYSTLLSFLKLLSAEKSNDLIVRSFEIRFLDGLGLLPHLSGCVICRETPGGVKHFFSSAKGGMVCSACASNAGARGLIGLSMGTASFLQAARRFDALKLDRLQPSKELLDESDKILDDFIRFQTGRVLKTKKFMESIRRAGI